VLRLSRTARLVLPALAWISAGSGIVGLLAAPAVPRQMAAWPAVGAISNLLSPAFCAWTTQAPQFEPQVRRAFAGRVTQHAIMDCHLPWR
jgi:hypothetical protein